MAAGERLRILPPVRYPPRPSLEALAARLRRYGFSSRDAALLQEACTVCAPRGRLRGLGLAVLHVSELFPEESRPRLEWLPAVRQWFRRDPAARRSFALQPYATTAPVTAFLVSLAPALPAEFSQAIFSRMLDLLADHVEAERSCYALYLAAKHLAEQRQTNAAVAERLAAGDWRAAIAAMTPPQVRRSGVLEGYQAALRNAIGQRKPAAPHEPAPDRRQRRAAPKARSAPPSVTPAASLTAVLALVGRVPADGATEAADDDESEQVEAANAACVSGRRRSSGLQANIALGVPRGLGDLDPLKMQRLLSRLASSDLERAAQWLLKVSLITLYCTGWPAAMLGALAEARDVRYEPAAGSILVPGARVCPWPEVHGRTFRILLHPHLVRLFDSLRRAGLFRLPNGDPIASAHVSAGLRVLCAGDAARLTQAMLRGAAWWVGRRNGWTPERLILCTCTCDPAFRNDFHYLAFGDEVDARPLHGLMLAALADAERRWRSGDRHDVLAAG